jgi:hypothetical protein
MSTCRAQQRYTGVTCLRYMGHDGEHEFPVNVPEKPKARKRRVSTREFKLASMIAAILDEPGDDPYHPSDVRMEQARRLTSLWANSNINAAVYEILNLKRGYCVRCEADPCPVCGSDSTTMRNAWDNL